MLSCITKEGPRRTETRRDHGVSVRLKLVPNQWEHDSQPNADAAVISNLWHMLIFSDAGTFSAWAFLSRCCWLCPHTSLSITAPLSQVIFPDLSKFLAISPTVPDFPEYYEIPTLPGWQTPRQCFAMLLMQWFLLSLYNFAKIIQIPELANHYLLPTSTNLVHIQIRILFTKDILASLPT